MFKISVIGNLGSDCRKNEGNFSTFYSFSVAHTRKYNNQQGQAVEETIWVNCVVNWDCKNISPFLKKGTKVYCSGDAKLRIFKSADGSVEPTITCYVSEIELCGGNRPDTAVTKETTEKDNIPF